MSHKNRGKDGVVKPPDTTPITSFEGEIEPVEKSYFRLPAIQTALWLVIGVICLNLIGWSLLPRLILDNDGLSGAKNVLALVNAGFFFGALSLCREQWILFKKFRSSEVPPLTATKNAPSPQPTLIQTLIRWSVGVIGGIVLTFVVSTTIIQVNNGNIDILNLELVVLISVAGIIAFTIVRWLNKKHGATLEKVIAADTPLTQQRKTSQLPQWIKELPLEDVNDQKENFRLIAEDALVEAKKKFAEQHKTVETEKADKAYSDLQAEIEFLEMYVVGLFKQRDYDAKYYQTAYRRYQVGYMLLAVLAAIFGSLLALNLNENSANEAHGRFWVAVFGFLETVVALATTYLASISGRENALEKWLENRQKAEGLRREYQQFLMRLTPYDKGTTTELEESLKRRAAAINLLGSPDIDDDDLRNAIVEAAKDQ